MRVGVGILWLGGRRYELSCEQPLDPDVDFDGDGFTIATSGGTPAPGDGDGDGATDLVVGTVDGGDVLILDVDPGDVAGELGVRTGSPATAPGSAPTPGGRRRDR